MCDRADMPPRAESPRLQVRARSEENDGPRLTGRKCIGPPRHEEVRTDAFSLTPEEVDVLQTTKVAPRSNCLFTLASDMRPHPSRPSN